MTETTICAKCAHLRWPGGTGWIWGQAAWLAAECAATPTKEGKQDYVSGKIIGRELAPCKDVNADGKCEKWTDAQEDDSDD